MTERKRTADRIPWFREVEVFTSGAEGYHTFRIPALVTAPDGTLLAFCEGRRQGRGDYQALYVVLKRSTDNGATWGDLQVLAGDGRRTTHNPTALVDRHTKTVWLFYNHDADTTHAMSSTDSGATWSDPADITSGVKPATWTFYALAPGHGIQLKSGRLMVPSGHAQGMRRDSIFSHSHVFYSDDHGAHWKVGGVLPGGSGECEVVETKDGSLYMTVRPTDRRLLKRVCSWSRDGGATWSELTPLDDLPDPICQASILRYTDARSHKKDRVLLCNLATTTSRDTITARVSYDECKSWAVSKVLYPGPSAYCDLSIAGDMSICCLYERGVSHAYESIRLAQFNLEWLTNGADHLD